MLHNKEQPPKTRVTTKPKRYLLALGAKLLAGTLLLSAIDGANSPVQSSGVNNLEQPGQPKLERGFLAEKYQISPGSVIGLDIPNRNLLSGLDRIQAQSFDSLFPEQIPLVRRLDPPQEQPDVEGWSDSYHLPHGYLEKDGAPYQELAWYHLYIGEGLFDKKDSAKVFVRFPDVDYTVSVTFTRLGERGLKMIHEFDPGTTRALRRKLTYGNRYYPELDFNQPITYTSVLREGFGPIFDMRLNGSKLYLPDTFQI